MALDANDTRPVFRQIAADLQRQIDDGSWLPGDKLPSVRELMDLYDVTSQTIQSAIRLLRGQGLVSSVHGRGTFVATDLDPSAFTGPDHDEVPAQFQVLHEYVDHLASQIEDLRQELHELRHAVEHLLPASADQIETH